MPGTGRSSLLLPCLSHPLPDRSVTLVAACGRWRLPRRPPGSDRALNAISACGTVDGPAQPPEGAVVRWVRDFPSASRRARCAGERASAEGAFLAAFPARVQFISSSWRVCLAVVTKGSKIAPVLEDFSLSVSRLRPVHESFFRRITSELGLR